MNPGEQPSRHSHHVLIHFQPPSYGSSVRETEHSPQPSLLDESFPEGFPSSRIEPKLLIPERSPPDNTHSHSVTFPSYTWHMSQSRGSQREKHPRVRVRATPFWALEREREMKAKGDGGQAVRGAFR